MSNKTLPNEVVEAGNKIYIFKMNRLKEIMDNFTREELLVRLNTKEKNLNSLLNGNRSLIVVMKIYFRLFPNVEITFNLKK